MYSDLSGWTGEDPDYSNEIIDPNPETKKRHQEYFVFNKKHQPNRFDIYQSEKTWTTNNTSVLNLSNNSVKRGEDKFVYKGAPVRPSKLNSPFMESLFELISKGDDHKVNSRQNNPFNEIDPNKSDSLLISKRKHKLEQKNKWENAMKYLTDYVSTGLRTVAKEIIKDELIKTGKLKQIKKEKNLLELIKGFISISEKLVGDRLESVLSLFTFRSIRYYEN